MLRCLLLASIKGTAEQMLYTQGGVLCICLLSPSWLGNGPLVGKRRRQQYWESSHCPNPVSRRYLSGNSCNKSGLSWEWQAVNHVSAYWMCSPWFPKEKRKFSVPLSAKCSLLDKIREADLYWSSFFPLSSLHVTSAFCFLKIPFLLLGLLLPFTMTTLSTLWFTS